MDDFKCRPSMQRWQLPDSQQLYSGNLYYNRYVKGIVVFLGLKVFHSYLFQWVENRNAVVTSVEKPQ